MFFFFQELVGFSIVALGTDRNVQRSRVRSVPNLRCQNRQPKNHIMPADYLTPYYVNNSFAAAGDFSALTTSESCGVSLNEVRSQLEDLSRAHYDAESKRIVFGESGMGEGCVGARRGGRRRICANTRMCAGRRM